MKEVILTLESRTTKNVQPGDTIAAEDVGNFDVLRILDEYRVVCYEWPWWRYYTHPVRAFFIRNYCKIFGPIYNKDRK